MTKVRERPAIDPAARGYSVVYRANESNRCPGCGRAQWFIGRITAECGFCGTAVALAEAQWSGAGRASPKLASLVAAPPLSEEAMWAERRRHERLRAAGRVLQLLVDGAPYEFTLQNISAGGVMGKAPADLAPSTSVHLRFEGGILVPAVVKWTEGPAAGLAFTSPVLLDLNPQG